MPNSIQSKKHAVVHQTQPPIRKALLKPAARLYLNELQIEADYQAACARQLNPMWRRGMMLLINRERLLSADEVPQVFISKKYPANNM